ncbi:MAG: hypothetical protein ACM359_02930 [Bacillota bacterium]
MQPRPASGAFSCACGATGSGHGLGQRAWVSLRRQRCRPASGSGDPDRRSRRAQMPARHFTPYIVRSTGRVPTGLAEAGPVLVGSPDRGHRSPAQAIDGFWR